AAVAKVADDQEYVEAFRSDKAWEGYRARLCESLRQLQAQRFRGELPRVGCLPAFNRRNWRPPRPSHRLDSQQMFPWANDYLDKRVLPSLLNDFVETPEPLPYVPIQAGNKEDDELEMSTEIET
ncbi:MAG: hypothetical protein SGPRY_012144, partial [Prymnesium sp.]